MSGKQQQQLITARERGLFTGADGRLIRCSIYKIKYAYYYDHITLRREPLSKTKSGFALAKLQLTYESSSAS